MSNGLALHGTRFHCMPWVYLLLASLFEISFAISMKLMNGHRHLPWTVVFYFSVILSFAFLQQATRSLPIGTAYAIWTGIGGLGVASIGMVWLGDPVSPLRITCLVLLVIALAGLKVTAAP